MIFFNTLSEPVQIIFLALCALGFISQLIFLCLCIGRKKNIILTLATAAVAVFSVFNVARLAYGAPVLSENTGLLSGDFAVIISIAVNISLGTIALILSLAESKKSVISASRLPQYLENLKDAVLFSDKSGRVLLANHKIRELCKRITRSELGNANDFCSTIFSAKSNNRFSVFNIDGKLIFRFSEDSAWEFTLTKLDGGNYIITATDSTQLLNTAEKITENKRLIKEAENRLQWTLDNLDGLKIQAEIAEQNAPLRTQIRDYSNDLYESIANDESIDALQIGTQLIPTEKQLPLIISAFELVGVSVSVIGNIPSDSARFSTLLELLFVCASSAVAHCRAERITMAIYEGSNKLTANINCDGTLLHSRYINAFDNSKKQIASLGGTLTITKEPSLKLSVMLPK